MTTTKRNPRTYRTNPCRSGVHTMDVVASVDGDLIVNAISYGIGNVQAEAAVPFFAETPGLARAILDAAIPESVTATSDGRGAIVTEWHTGPESDWVRYERWTTAGRVAHGFVDATSRKLLQAG